MKSKPIKNLQHLKFIFSRLKKYSISFFHFVAQSPIYLLAFLINMMPRKRGRRLQFPGKTLLLSTEYDEVSEYFGSLVLIFWREIYTCQVHAAVTHPSLLRGCDKFQPMPSSAWQLWKLIRKEKYKTVVFLQPRSSIIPSAVAFFAKAKYTVGFGRGTSSAFIKFRLPFQDTGMHFCHQWKKLIENASLVSLSSMPYPKFFPKESVPLFYEPKLALVCLRTAILDPYQSKRTPLFPMPDESLLEEVQYQLQALGYAVRMMRVDEKRDFPENLTYDELYASAQKADLVVDFDSIAGHIAAAAGTRVLSIFFERSHTTFQPFHNKSLAYSAMLACQPCHRMGLKFECRYKDEKKFLCAQKVDFKKALQMQMAKPSKYKLSTNKYKSG